MEVVDFGVLVSHFVEGEGFPTLNTKTGPFVPKVLT